MFQSKKNLGVLLLSLAYVINLSSSVPAKADDDNEGDNVLLVPTPEHVASVISKSLAKAGSETCMQMALCSLVVADQGSSSEEVELPDIHNETLYLVHFVDALGTSQDKLKGYTEALEVGEEKGVNCAEAFKCENSTEEALSLLDEAGLAVLGDLQPIFAQDERAVYVAQLMASYEKDDCFKRRICAFSKEYKNDPEGFKQKYNGSNLNDYIFVTKMLHFVPFFRNESLEILQPTIDAFNLGKANGDCVGQISCNATDAEVLEDLEEATEILCLDGSCPPNSYIKYNKEDSEEDLED